MVLVFCRRERNEWHIDCTGEGGIWYLHQLRGRAGVRTTMKTVTTRRAAMSRTMEMDVDENGEDNAGVGYQ